MQIELWLVAVICKNKHVLSALFTYSRTPGSRIYSDPFIHNMVGWGVALTDDLEFLDWIYESFPETSQRGIHPNHFAALAERGNLGIVRWILDRGYELPTSMLDVAAEMGNMPLLLFLHERGTSGCLNLAMGYAAEFGHLDIIKFLHENRTEANDEVNYDHGFSSFLPHQKVDETCASYLPLKAARKGHDCIKYAHDSNFQ